jgi:hypothetical protein
MKTFRSLNMRFQREQNKLRDGEDIEVRQTKRYRTYEYKDDDANNVLVRLFPFSSHYTLASAYFYGEVNGRVNVQ